MQTPLASIFVTTIAAVVIGFEEPPRPVPPACVEAAACFAIDPAPNRIGLEAKLSDGKLIVSYAPEADGCGRVERVVLHELTNDGYSWDWETSEDGGATWMTRRHAAYSKDVFIA